MIKQFRGKYAFLSNFYDAPVEYMGIRYKNNEAAFQAAKVTSNQARMAFKDLNPSEAKRKGRRVKLRDDWEDVKTEVMYEVVKAKFSQNKDLKRKLIDTGEVYLEEGNNWGDRVWGTVQGEGENRLGKILMQVRSELA